MINKITLANTIDAVYALAALKSIIDDPTLPGPIGQNEEESLRALAQRKFAEVCAELNVEPASSESVDLTRDCHELLQAIVTDRTIAELTLRSPRTDLMRRLRCRLRPSPPKTAARY